MKGNRRLVAPCAPALMILMAAACNLGSPASPEFTLPSTTMTSSEGSCDPTLTPTTGDLPDDVNAVLIDKCQGCHSAPTQHHAPFPIVSFEDTQKPFGLTTKRRWQRMSEVVSPGGLPHMPYGTAPQLTTEQLATLQAWFAQCAMPIAEGTGNDLLDDGGPERADADPEPRDSGAD